MADENIDSRIIKELRNRDFIVISIREKYGGMPDEDVLYLCKDNKAILLSEDKDFGEWVFAYDFKDVSVILLRYNPIDLQKIIPSIINLLSEHDSELISKFVVITTNKIRIRNI
ncbi:MAG: DUF5615 family PIN-like protein [Bacteroidota bacterium]|nr:DUF5615 family PIN-like protein [Bacteroidota bacterium]